MVHGSRPSCSTASIAVERLARVSRRVSPTKQPGMSRRQKSLTFNPLKRATVRDSRCHATRSAGVTSYAATVSRLAAQRGIAPSHRHGLLPHRSAWRRAPTPSPLPARRSAWQRAPRPRPFPAKPLCAHQVTGPSAEWRGSPRASWARRAQGRVASSTSCAASR
jgi:hypothetical protein